MLNCLIVVASAISGSFFIRAVALTCAPTSLRIRSGSFFRNGTLDTMATLGKNMFYAQGEVMLVVCPSHAETIANDGWSKQHLKEH